MKKIRFFTALMMVLLLLLNAPISAMAATWEVNDTDEMLNAFNTDTDAEVVINMNADISLGYTTTGENQTYTINGNGNTLSDAAFGGSGDVIVNADITSNGTGLYTQDEVDVTVNGDVTGAVDGVSAYNDSKVTVEGDVTGEGDWGVAAFDDASVSVEGDVTGEYTGVVVNGDSSVSVSGDVTGGYTGVNTRNEPVFDDEGNLTDIIGNNATVTVGGDVTGADEGVIAAGNAQITVDGSVSGENYAAIRIWNDYFTDSEGNETEIENEVMIDVAGDVSGMIDVTGGAEVSVGGDVTGSSYTGGILTEEELQDPLAYSDGTTGINASGNAKVTVEGNVTGGDAMGTYGYGGEGICMLDNATVTVGGDVTGGSVTADPDVMADGDAISLGGSAVVFAGGTLSIGGDATGGSTNGDNGEGGNGIMMVPTEDGRGSITVKGTVSGGEGAASVYYYIENDEDRFAPITAGAVSSENGPALDSNEGEEAAQQIAKLNLTVGDTGDNPRTGDNSHIVLLTVLCISSALALGALTVFRRRVF